MELNKALTRLGSADQVARFCAEHVSFFDGVNVATACHRLAKMSKIGLEQGERRSSRYAKSHSQAVTQAIQALLVRALETSASFKPQDVANLMWALATLGMVPGAEPATHDSKGRVLDDGNISGYSFLLPFESCVAGPSVMKEFMFSGITGMNVRL